MEDTNSDETMICDSYIDNVSHKIFISYEESKYSKTYNSPPPENDTSWISQDDRWFYIFLRHQVKEYGFTKKQVKLKCILTRELSSKIYNISWDVDSGRNHDWPKTAHLHCNKEHGNWEISYQNSTKEEFAFVFLVKSIIPNEEEAKESELKKRKMDFISRKCPIFIEFLLVRLKTIQLRNLLEQ